VRKIPSPWSMTWVARFRKVGEGRRIRPPKELQSGGDSFAVVRSYGGGVVLEVSLNGGGGMAVTAPLVGGGGGHTADSISGESQPTSLALVLDAKVLVG
jgi:hypothetical protein